MPAYIQEQQIAAKRNVDIQTIFAQRRRLSRLLVDWKFITLSFSTGTQMGITSMKIGSYDYHIKIKI